MRRRVRGEVIDFKLGPIRVVVSPKPIEALPQVLDALVSSDDTHLSMGRGVSAAILKAAGPNSNETRNSFCQSVLGMFVSLGPEYFL